MTDETYEGGCSCGSVRFKLAGRPIWTNVCHCDACKKRTGSAFGISVVVDENQIAHFSGETSKYLRQGESGRMCTYEFCAKCGTTVRWKVDLINRCVFAGGALDDPKSIEVVAEMYTGRALPWVRVGCELSVPGAPDDEFRARAIEAVRAIR